MIRIAVAGLVLASSALAQSDSPARCPVVNGISATATAGGSRPRANESVLVPRVETRSSIDTTWTFDVRERQWTWRELAASVGLGYAGSSRSAPLTGTTTAPDSAARTGWSVCAAAGVGMREATLSVRGARGTVHLRADATALTRASSAMRDTTGRPRR